MRIIINPRESIVSGPVSVKFPLLRDGLVALEQRVLVLDFANEHGR